MHWQTNEPPKRNRSWVSSVRKGSGKRKRPMRGNNVNSLAIEVYCTAPLTSATWENRHLSPYLQPSAVPKYRHTRLLFIATGSRCLMLKGRQAFARRQLNWDDAVYIVFPRASLGSRGPAPSYVMRNDQESNSCNSSELL